MQRDGESFTVVVAKQEGEPLGAEVDAAVFDGVQTCDNHCEFCFVHQLPRGMRRSLYLKDDDYRLSFLYGNFTTLTRFTELDYERVVTERLSPLYVSIHSTDPDVRAAILQNRRGAVSLRWLRLLLDAGIEVHGQVVVCPGVNDGDVLADTLAGVLDRFPELRTLCVVPLGLSRFNRQSRMRLHTRAEAAAVVDLVESWQSVFLRVLGRRLAFVADEYYLMCGRSFPAAEHYEGFDMHEDGIGMARAFETEFSEEGHAPTPPRSGFFAWVDGAPADGYRAPRQGSAAEMVSGPNGSPVSVSLGPRRAGRTAPVAVLTGTLGAAVVSPLVESLGRRDARVIPVENRFFGGNIGVTGLMVGEDVVRVLAGEPEGHRYLLPDVCLSRGRFLDGMTTQELPRPVEVVATHGRALRLALGAVVNPVVAVVGRPNVGKSTLVNRILGRREAIVEERPGVTRDRKAVDAEWQGRRFTLLDTGGWSASSDELDAKVSAQAERAVREADAVLFVVDASVGLTADDDQVARVLYSADVPVMVVANKIDHAAQADSVWELLGLGLGTPHQVSALHGRGTGDLLEELVARLDAASASTALEQKPGSTPDPAGEGLAAAVAEAFSVVLVGRPNAGKSTLFNRLIGEDRAIVHDLPGTTRDAIDTLIETDEGPVRFIDTAGMRRRARIDSGTEYYSLVRALRAVDTADVALLVIDSSVGVTHQDQRLAERVDAAGCPVVILLNKWDLADTETRLDLGRDVQDRLGFLGGPPVLRISALSGKGVTRLWPSLSAAVAEYRTRIPTRRVNEVVRAAQSAQPAPAGARILYATQVATDPPTFTLFANRTLPRTYLRYIERKLRESFDLGVTALKFRVRRRDE